ncbi:hypothetical protein [Flavobacterium urocaniciphilum]|uniref:DUF1579 domain-containing protein n=1 Tax=Flavobacterium urocaniciphilum TaxID=1299341 RepID=A0A1H8Z2U7_9FLAO|nr:hypothetical protein [Flavobacterium urocaniciphilum]SEP58672.1 hypothetical protein SAMN05444005_101449 [Flavobacterium urocaniciphilum]
MIWKKGRGKLGVLEPLLGNWVANAESPMGKVKCTRTFEKVLNGNYIQLIAKWEFGEKVYEEIALFGIDEKELFFKSFTSDGKNSSGKIADATDIHPNAICFIAEMPAGIARMIYWPNENEGFHWAVESKTKKGWNRFTEHHYKKVEY